MAQAKERENAMLKKVAITFDDGPNPDYTEQLLDGLKERGVEATFFLLGKEADIAEYEQKIELRKRAITAAYFNTFDLT